MRSLSFLFFVLVSVFFTQTLAYSDQEKVLNSLDFTENAKGGGTLVIGTQEHPSGTNFYIGGEKPRIIFDFKETTHKFANKVILSPNGLVRTARFGIHQNPLKTRMVIDLMPGVEKPRYTQEIQNGSIRIEIFPYQESDEPQKAAPKVVDSLQKIEQEETPSQRDETDAHFDVKVEKNNPVKLTKQNTPIEPIDRELLTPPSIATTSVLKPKETVQDPTPGLKEIEIARQKEEKHSVEESPKPQTPQESGSSNTVTESLIFESFVPPVVEVDDALSESVGEQEAQEKTISPVYLKEIRHSTLNEEEDVLAFLLTSFNTPLVTAVEEEQLMVVCEFSDVFLHEDMVRDQVINGNYVEEIKVTNNFATKTVQVVVKLKSEFSYDLEQTYYKNANVFALTVKGHKA